MPIGLSRCMLATATAKTGRRVHLLSSGACACPREVCKCSQVHWNVQALGISTGNETKIDQVVRNEGQPRMFNQHELDEFGPLITSLKACARQKDLRKGSQIHANVLRRGILGKNIYMGNHLVDFYAKCGALAKAQEVFDALPARNVFSWTVLIGGYAQHGHGEKALDCFEQMRDQGLSPDAVTLTCLLKACGSIGSVETGKDIHAEILRRGFMEKDSLLGNALVDMYGKCGLLAKAQEVFDELPMQSLAAWNALIAGYAQHGHGQEALNCFKHMQDEGLIPDVVTFISVLKACGSIKASDVGKNIHARIVKEGMVGKHIEVGNALVDMYAKCGVLIKAQEVFDNLPVQGVIAWTALINGYAQHGHGEEALTYFDLMQEKGILPNAITYVCILRACGSIGAVKKGEEVHCKIIREELLGKNDILGTALLDMYAKCGVLLKAQEVFDELSVQSIMSWTALINGYAQHGYAEEALHCYEQMQHKGISSSPATFICVLKACGSIGTIAKGKDVHTKIVKDGNMKNNLAVGNALMDMYMSCGAVWQGQEVFDELPAPNVVSWTILLGGYAQFGIEDMVFKLYNKMVKKFIEPSTATLTLVLNVCSASGLLDEGLFAFKIIYSHYIAPTLDHYACMVDLFARAGHFDKAVALIGKMPSSDYLPLWSALLGACQKWGFVRLGKLAFKSALLLDERYVPTYVCMFNIYSAAGMMEDADKIEAMIMRNKACLLLD